MSDIMSAPVVEHAVLEVRPERADDFERDVARALPLLLGQPGCLGARVLRLHETPGRFVLLVGWTTVAAHEDGFRASPEYPLWRELLHHYYDEFPTVEHGHVVAGHSAADERVVPYPSLPQGARFDHVCIAGPAMRPLLARYRDLLGGRFLWGEVLANGTVVVTLDYPGGGHVELMAPQPGSTFLDSFLARTGGSAGLHHVTWIVPDLRAAVAAAVAGGARVVGEHHDDPVWNEAFLHPSEGGVLVQFAQTGPAVAQELRADLDAVLAAAGESDGPE